MKLKTAVKIQAWEKYFGLAPLRNEVVWAFVNDPIFFSFYLKLIIFNGNKKNFEEL